MLLAALSVMLQAQQKYTLSGTVSDAASGESLPGVNFVIGDGQTGTSTNEYGFFSITLPEGTYTVSVIYLGYETITETIELNKNIRKDYRLSDESIQLSAVEIVANRTDKA